MCIFPKLIVSLGRGGGGQTDIATYRLNRPIGPLNENNLELRPTPSAGAIRGYLVILSDFSFNF